MPLSLISARCGQNCQRRQQERRATQRCMHRQQTQDECHHDQERCEQRLGGNDHWWVQYGGLADGTFVTQTNYHREIALYTPKGLVQSLNLHIIGKPKLADRS